MKCAWTYACYESMTAMSHTILHVGLISAVFLAACSSSDGANIPPPDTSGAATDPGAGTDPGGAAGTPKSIPAGGTEGCGAGAFTAGDAQAKSIEVNGAKRTYLLTIPAGYDAYRAYPLVFVFHGGGGTGKNERQYFGLEEIAAGNAIFAYPDGKGGDWDLDTKTEDNEDVAFFDALVAEIGKNACIAKSKVFATGSSMGAYFSNQLGCRRGGVLRAIAPHAGGGPFDDDDAYDDQGHLRCAGKPVAAMIFHGEDDDTVSLADGKLTRDHWVWANGCRDNAQPSNPSPCVTYDGCKNQVTWCQIPGLGHSVWSAGRQATWTFFASFE